jgi:hypothetical protein
MSETKMTFPVLVIGGEKANGAVLGQQLRLVASNVTVVVLKDTDTGCWRNGQRKQPTRS